MSPVACHILRFRISFPIRTAVDAGAKENCPGQGKFGIFKTAQTYATSLERSGLRFRDIRFRGEVFFSRKRIREIFYSYNENYHMGNRLNATKERLIKMLNRKIESETKAQWVQEAVQNLSDEEIPPCNKMGQKNLRIVTMNIASLPGSWS